MTSPRLTTRDLVLEAPTPADAEDWSEAQDDECVRWFGWPGRPGVGRCRAHLEQVATGRDTDSYTWAIRTATGLAGGIDLKRLEGRWNVSYFVHPDHRGRGIATRSLARVSAWAFDDLDVDAVSTGAAVDNLASRRVLEKAGFRPVGEEIDEDSGHLHARYELASGARHTAVQP